MVARKNTSKSHTHDLGKISFILNVLNFKTLKFTTNIWFHRQRNIDNEKLLNMQDVYNSQFNMPPYEFDRFRD